MNSNNVFFGENSVLDYLNPDKNPPTPLIEIPKNLNPYKDRNIRIFAKLMNQLPLANVKSLPAYNMLVEAKKEKKLDKVDTIIENSSGNTFLSLAVISRLMGISKTQAIVSNEVSLNKLQLLRFFGVDTIVNQEAICPNPNDKKSGIYKAKKFGIKDNYFNSGQYNNLNNPKAHEKWTAKQIYSQLNGEIDIFYCGLGTTGTMYGCGKYFKQKNLKIFNLGVVRSPNNPIPVQEPKTYSEKSVLNGQK